MEGGLRMEWEPKIMKPEFSGQRNLDWDVKSIRVHLCNREVS